MTNQYKVEVIADSSGQWAGNGLTFEDQNDAERYANDLFMRWTLVRKWRVLDQNGNVVILNEPL